MICEKKASTVFELFSRHIPRFTCGLWSLTKFQTKSFRCANRSFLLRGVSQKDLFRPCFLSVGFHIPTFSGKRNEHHLFSVHLLRNLGKKALFSWLADFQWVRRNNFYKNPQDNGFFYTLIIGDIPILVRTSQPYLHIWQIFSWKQNS